MGGPKREAGLRVLCASCEAGCRSGKTGGLPSQNKAHLRICVCMYIYKHMYIYIHIYTCVYMFIYFSSIHMPAHTYICIYMHRHTYIHIHIYVYMWGGGAFFEALSASALQLTSAAPNVLAQLRGLFTLVWDVWVESFYFYDRKERLSRSRSRRQA